MGISRLSKGGLLVFAGTVATAGFGGASAWAGGATSDPAPTAEQPEYGRIQWVRPFDAALADAEKNKKPMLVLFQEVPGCGTCVNYGRHVLSHPLIVEAAETEFVPTVVLNNAKGDDLRILNSFKEAAWNNPVVRFVSADRSELAPRVGDDYTVGGLASAMARALATAGKDAPTYLQLLAQEETWRAGKLETATFAMHCFWEGEAAFNTLDGVVETMPGFAGDLEVVEVQFDPRAVDYKSLLNRARQMKCADRVYTHNDNQLKISREAVGELAGPMSGQTRPDKEPKHYLSQSEYRFVPMTPLQAMRVNAALGSKQQTDVFLSLRQKVLLSEVRANPNAKWPAASDSDDFIAAWDAAWAVADSLSRD